MNEQKLIAALTEILMNHKTGPLSNLGSSLELDGEGMIEVETHSIPPFSHSIDVPQLAREVLLKWQVPEPAKAETLGDLAAVMAQWRADGITLGSILYAAQKAFEGVKR